MVYFTCDVCGQSVKKKQVEKHCQTSCPSAWYFTCMDCNKVFEGYEYDKHTSCVTETERYAGKFLSAKAEQKKAAKEAANGNGKPKETNQNVNGKPKATNQNGKIEAAKSKYLINGNEWMGWKRTIRHVLQDQKVGKMEVEALWQIIRETYMKSSLYKGEDKEKLRSIFTEKMNRPRFELVENGKFIKLKPRKRMN